MNNRDYICGKRNSKREISFQRMSHFSDNQGGKINAVTSSTASP